MGKGQEVGDRLFKHHTKVSFCGYVRPGVVLNSAVLLIMNIESPLWCTRCFSQREALQESHRPPLTSSVRRELTSTARLSACTRPTRWWGRSIPTRRRCVQLPTLPRSITHLKRILRFFLQPRARDVISKKQGMSSNEMNDVTERLFTTYPKCQQDVAPPTVCVNSVAREPASEDEIKVKSDVINAKCDCKQTSEFVFRKFMRSCIKRTRLVLEGEHHAGLLKSRKRPATARNAFL